MSDIQIKLYKCKGSRIWNYDQFADAKTAFRTVSSIFRDEQGILMVAMGDKWTMSKLHDDKIYSVRSQMTGSNFDYLVVSCVTIEETATLFNAEQGEQIITETTELPVITPQELLEKLSGAGIPATLRADGKGVDITPTCSIVEHQDNKGAWYVALANGLIAEYFRPNADWCDKIIEFAKYLLGRKARANDLYKFSCYSKCTYTYNNKRYLVYSFFGREFHSKTYDYISTALEKLETIYKSRKPGEEFTASLVSRFADAIAENAARRMRCSFESAKSLKGIEAFISEVWEKSLMTIEGQEIL